MKTKFSKKLLSFVTAVSLFSGVFAFSTAQAADVTADTIMGSMTLYDYDVSSVESSGTQLLFGRQGVSSNPEYNRWDKNDNYRIVQGLAADELVNGQFELAEREVTYYRYKGLWGNWSDWSTEKPPSWTTVETKTETAKLTVPDTADGKLFSDGEKVGTYQMPFDHVGNGVYEYDSADKKLTANNYTNVLEVSDYARGEAPKFMPLGDENYYFGAAVELPFVYKNGGTVNNGDDMVFEFSGDDDVWVYVDGKLVLDMGGIHGAVSGTINFRTLEATITNGDIYGGGATTTTFDFDTSTSDHTIQMFYLERGANESNFKMSFNLIQPTNYVVKYYDGKLYNGKPGDAGLLATVVQNSRDDGTKLYAGDKVKQSEIKINVNDKTAELIASDEYYGGFVVDDNFMPVTDPNAVVTTVTDDDTDIVYVIFLPKPSYTVTYWMGENEADSSTWTQVTQKANVGTVGQQITAADIDVTFEFEGQWYTGKIVSQADENGVYGTLSADAPFNVDVLVVPTTEPTAEPTTAPSTEPSTEPSTAPTTEPTIAPTEEPTTPPSEEPTVPPYDNPYTLESAAAYIFGRTDTEMQAEDGMKRGEAAAVLYRLLKQNNLLGDFTYSADTTSAFLNLKGRWDRSALEYMAYLGLYTVEEGISPDNNITRAEAFKMMAVALGFTDDVTLPLESYAAILVDAGYVQGDENGNLNLGDEIRRAEFCKIYNMIIERDAMGLTMADGSTVTAETYGFVDLFADQWYYEIMLKATSAYDDAGNVDLDLRALRNVIDDYA